MNAANLCPEPWPILEAANQLRREYNRDVSQQGRTVDGEPGTHVRGIREARELVAGGLGLPRGRDKNIALVRNTSEGNNLLSNGFRKWNPDGRDKVVIWDGENHPTNETAWRFRAAQGRRTTNPGPLFEVVPVKPPPEGTARQIARAFLEPLGDDPDRVRFIAFTQVSNGSGMRIPDAAIDIIWNAVKDRRSCHLHIDGAMSWGALPIDLANPKCHSITASAHKWFLGPKETGFLYMDPARVEDFMPQSFAYDYKITVPRHWRGIGATAAERFELLGQRDDVNIIHMASAQLMWNAVGFERALERIEGLADRLFDRLVEDGWVPVTPRKKENRWAILRFQAGRQAGKRSLYRYLFDRGIAASAGNLKRDDEESFDETIRLCPTIYNLEEDVQRAVEIMNEWRRGL